MSLRAWPLQAGARPWRGAREYRQSRFALKGARVLFTLKEASRKP